MTLMMMEERTAMGPLYGSSILESTPLMLSLVAVQSRTRTPLSMEGLMTTGTAPTVREPLEEASLELRKRLIFEH